MRDLTEKEQKLYDMLVKNFNTYFDYVFAQVNVNILDELLSEVLEDERN